MHKKTTCLIAVILSYVLFVLAACGRVSSSDRLEDSSREQEYRTGFTDVSEREDVYDPISVTEYPEDLKRLVYGKGTLDE